MNASTSSASAEPRSGDARFDLDGPVATVTLCRPQVLNAQTPALWADLREFGRTLPGDVRVVVIRGEGRAFSAGLDTKAAVTTLGELAAAPDADERIAGFQEAFSWLRHPSLITIAAVQGHAIGGGFQLALACDFRVVADDVAFSMAEIRLGLVPDLGGTKRLVELVGYARALELCVTGRRVAAAEASQIGLANVVVPREELDDAVKDLTAAVLEGPRDAVIEIKALLAAAAGHTFAQQEAAERAAQQRRIADLSGRGE
ncbi:MULTISPECIES: enoyl-CoA hydratase/isomerase family protein [Dactylosporangium]|uniref:Enoyl-CoA hydratase n=2 Tax=Dactylosporangium TaxID=35753 RepID=A0A9W6NKQ5_9ACTN|nr:MULTISPECIES: enoyl-CoA hydratase/isomerase family protein [Dactylosporangium]UAB98439.1 enoyl-CoA hydratase/isomerase family protein [Dactylosporangium vinaceum]UWZ46694.1 enoyl-CoA hydratase/isomerase family protein [Dactylosporangium matsuzakiense]GLL01165.1 enoyl-CoA hydratase [Dactylosporangium matsuzakiense]